MKNLTLDEKNLVCIYSVGGSRKETIAALRKMRGYLQADETELLSLTDGALAKLRGMSDEEYNTLDLTPDFAPEDFVYGG